MRVVEGDTIGMQDERYGKVVFLVTQDWFLVEVFPDLEDENTQEPVQVWTGIENVASIV